MPPVGGWLHRAARHRLGRFSDSPGVIHPDTRLRPAAGLDGQGRMTGFYVDADGLHSWRTLEPVDPAESC